MASKIPSGYGSWGPVPLSFTLAKFSGAERQVFEFYCAVCDKPSGVVRRSMYSTSKLLKVDYKTVYRAEKRLADAGYLIRLPDDAERKWVQVVDPRPATMDDVRTRKTMGENVHGRDGHIGESAPDPDIPVPDHGRECHPVKSEDKSKGQKPKRARGRAPRVNSSLPFRSGPLGLQGNCSKCGQWKPGLYPTDKGLRCGKHSAPPDL